MGKGSQQAAGDSTVRQTNLPEYADPYFRRLLQGAEDSTQPFQDNLSSPIYDDDGNITGFGQESTYQPYQGERIASSDMYGDIMGSRGMVRGIAESGIAGMPQAQAAGQAGMDIQADAIGGLRGLANYGGGDFQAVSPTSMMDGFQAVSPNSMMNEYQMANYSPSGEFNQYDFRDPSEFSQFGVRDDFSYSGYGFDPTRQFGTDEANKYMSPYMSAVVEDQKSQAIQDFERQGAGRAAQAVQAGAFGGSRQAIQESLAEESLQDRLGSIGAAGSQAAFEQAQQQFERDRSAQERQLGMQVGEFGRVQGGLASEQGRVDALRLQEQSQREYRQADEYARSGNMQAAEAARVQAANTAELGRTQAGIAGEMGRVQAGRVGENARMDAMRQQEAARTQAARAAENARMDSMMVGEAGRVQGANEASRQFGAGQGLAAYQAMGSGASNLAGLGSGLAGLGQQQRAADIQGAQLLETVGRDVRAEDQARLDMSYEDFARQRDYPMQQYERMAGILRGVPVTPNVDEQRFSSYNPMQQALGAGISGLGLYKGLTS
tara:strand:+ start:2588 stop:4234 length:1647 start_codon:yes stop_codon:yes gene_type:complete